MNLTIKYKYCLLIIPAICIITCLSCEEKRKISDKDFVEYKEPLQNVNKILVDKDADIIRKYCKRNKWNYSQTETGLFYEIYEKGKGLKAEAEKIVEMNYKVYLIDGTLCYTSDSLGTKTFVVGKGGVESGLEEGILLLHEGDKARFVLAPHLAHGLIGDENRIPPRSIIIYYIELLAVYDR